MGKPIIAIAYDFDGTLTPGNMQEYSFIPSLQIDKKDFWNDRIAMTKTPTVSSFSEVNKLLKNRPNEDYKKF